MIKAKTTFAMVLSAAMLANVIAMSACTPEDNSVTDEYAITLQYNDEGSSRPRTVYVEKGKSIESPAVPEREGYQISKWTDSEKDGNEITFPYTPSADTTIYAQWDAAKYDITFDFQTDATPYKINKAYDTQITSEEVEAIVLPENTGYEFRYWTTKADSDIRAVWPHKVKKETTFYAYWIAEGLTIFSLNFNANYEGAAAIDPVELVEGNSIEQRQAPQDPTRPGCKFLGWSLDPNATTREETISFPYTPTTEQADGKNINLYAVWERSNYTIRYYYNYTGSPNSDLYKTENVLGGDDLVEPDEITRVQDGVTFIFDGWYTNTVGGTKIEFPSPATGHMSLFAHWKAPMTTPADNKFDAEFTPIDPNVEYPGYSNSVKGTEMIQADRNQNSFSANYPILDDSSQVGHFIYCMYAKGAALTFKIYSTKAASRVTLYASLSLEMVENDVVMTPEGEWGFSFIVNDEALNYGSITVKGGTNVSTGGGFMGTFSEYRIGNVNLKEGWNTIVLRTNNDTSIGGVSLAWAPMIDYIRLDVGTKTEVSWQPEYDNLYRAN